MTIKETLQHFWFHNPTAMCKNIEESDKQSSCLSSWQKSNAILGIIWAVIWSAIVIIIVLIILRCLKRRRAVRQTRLNAYQESGRDGVEGRWHRHGNFTPGSCETQMTGPLERIPRHQPITLDGTSDLPYIAQRRVGLTLFPSSRCFSPVPSAYAKKVRTIAPRIPPLSLPKPAFATYRMENGIRVASGSGTSTFDSRVKRSATMPTKDSASRRGMTIRWVSDGA